MKNILACTVSSLASCPWPKGQGLALVLLCLPALAPAIELSLEENRAQRGNIGYVDMQRLFKLYPETIRAKENFEEVVRQAEDQVNLKRVSVIRLRAEIAQLKIDREALAKVVPAVLPPGSAAPKTEVSTAALAEALAPVISTSAAAQILPELAVASGPVAVSMEALPAAPAPVAAPALPLPMAAPAAPPPAPPSPLAELEDKLAGKVKDLALKETDFKDYQASAEKNLLDLESRRTEILLGKINKAVKAVAKREGISVIVDKGSILFGHDAVDLTEKVLKELKGA